MRTRLPVLALTLATAACAGGGPAGLGYSLPTQSQVTYSYGDTTIVNFSVMGQSMELAMRGAAEYGVAFGAADDGIGVTLTVQQLAASIGIPMAGTETVDESDVEGTLVFNMDREGNATVVSGPEVSVTASRMISALTTAHTFFPGLPNRPVGPGDRWVDTVSYDGDAEVGGFSEASIIEYTVVGSTVVDGRDLLEISLQGTTEQSSVSNMGGMQVNQTSTIEVEGHVLWDVGNALMFELVKTGSGTGSAAVPISPRPLPISVEVTQRARLQGL